MTYTHTRPYVSYVVLAIFVLIAPACTGRSSDQPKADLTGEYRIVGGERNGAPIDQTELTDTAIYITDKTIIAYDKERKEMFAATYTIDTKQTPWQITMISTKSPDVGTVAKGLIKAEQDKVKLVYALPNGQPPTDFKAGQEQQMFDMVKASQASG